MLDKMSHIHTERLRGTPWRTLAEEYGCAQATLRGQYSRWRQKMIDDYGIDVKDADEKISGHVALLREKDIRRITSLEDLIEFFNVDTERWQINHFRVNKWEMGAKNADDELQIEPLYQVRAALGKNVEREAEIARATLQQLHEDIASHTPAYVEPPTPELYVDDEPCLFEVAMMDPHIGMLAWNDEVGESYDLNIAIEEYARVGANLLDLVHMYPVERILLIVGNDTIHVDSTGQNMKGGVTAKGTAQDIDTRLPKIYTAARRALVGLIDMACTYGVPVDVQVVQGNHDPLTMYHLGETLQAWYRESEQVTVLNSPMKRDYYQYGANGLMFTHGEEYMRGRDSLPLIFATEAPAVWAATTYREIHCGHLHSTKQREYMAPTQSLSESRGIRTRVLPGLVPEDAWHFEEGYHHHRAATALVFKRSGGLLALHEVQP